VSSRSAGFVDGDALEPDRYAGRAQRAWRDGQTLVVEIDQYPGLNVVDIEHDVLDGAIYLVPYRRSTTASGTSEFRIELNDVQLSDDWHERVYWVTDETFSPFFDESSSKATRVKLTVLPTRPIE
jgi:hypothetical protein